MGGLFLRQFCVGNTLFLKHLGKLGVRIRAVLRYESIILPLHRAVPMVLNGVIRPSSNDFGDLCPLVAVGSVGFDQDTVFLLCPRVPPDVWIEVIVPTLSALLANSPRQVLSDHRPLLRAVLLDEADDLVIFFLGPWALHQVGVEHLLPAMQTLDISPVGEVLGNLLPALPVERLYGPAEKVILLGCPASTRGPPRGAAHTTHYGGQLDGQTLMILRVAIVTIGS
mmetsp:Transcript_11445/g.41880  ORF Transcript_11445/g.41880 Transcript_11445/m.41880 type:complete len:225 (+) Transcript_11445:3519-4193(+)